MGGTIRIFDICKLLDSRFKNKERFIGPIVKLETYFLVFVQLDEEFPDESNENPTKRTALNILCPSEQPHFPDKIDENCVELVFPKKLP